MPHAATLGREAECRECDRASRFTCGLALLSVRGPTETNFTRPWGRLDAPRFERLATRHARCPSCHPADNTRRKTTDALLQASRICAEWFAVLTPEWRRPVSGNIIDVNEWREAALDCKPTDLLHQALCNARADCAEGELSEGDREDRKRCCQAAARSSGFGLT